MQKDSSSGFSTNIDGFTNSKKLSLFETKKQKPHSGLVLVYEVVFQYNYLNTSTWDLVLVTAEIHTHLISKGF